MSSAQEEPPSRDEDRAGGFWAGNRLLKELSKANARDHNVRGKGRVLEHLGDLPLGETSVQPDIRERQSRADATLNSPAPIPPPTRVRYTAVEDRGNVERSSTPLVFGPPLAQKPVEAPRYTAPQPTRIPYSVGTSHASKQPEPMPVKASNNIVNPRSQISDSHVHEERRALVPCAIASNSTSKPPSDPPAALVKYLPLQDYVGSGEGSERPVDLRTEMIELEKQLLDVNEDILFVDKEQGILEKRKVAMKIQEAHIIHRLTALRDRYRSRSSTQTQYPVMSPDMGSLQMAPDPTPVQMLVVKQESELLDEDSKYFPESRPAEIMRHRNVPVLRPRPLENGTGTPSLYPLRPNISVGLGTLQVEKMRHYLFVPKSNRGGQGGEWISHLDMPVVFRTEMVRQIITKLLSGNRQQETWREFARNPGAQAEKGRCVGFVLAGDSEGKKMSWKGTSGNQKRACDNCVRKKRPCIRFMKPRELKGTIVAWFSLPEELRVGKKFEDIGFWVRPAPPNHGT